MIFIRLNKIYSYKDDKYKVKKIIPHKRRFLFWSWWEESVIYCNAYGIEFSREIKDFSKRFKIGHPTPIEEGREEYDYNPNEMCHTNLKPTTPNPFIHKGLNKTKEQ